MESLLIYFAKSSALLVVFFFVYHFLLRKETFFKSNRWYLLVGLVISVVLPLVTFKRIVWVEPAGKGFDWNTLSENTLYVAPQPEVFEIDWFLVVISVYIIGTLGFLLKFCIDFRALSKILRGQKIIRQEDYKFLDIAENVSPFSYFNYIVYNSSLYNPTELTNILEHEKVHSSQKHTIDVLIARFFCILFWYNPFVWLYKNAILQNLEFIADNEASKKISDIKAYQLTLLKITAHDSCVVLTNHFYQSLIKKRIVMLNKTQSRKWNSWKYAIVTPVLAAFLLYFQVEVVAQEKPAEAIAFTNFNTTEVVVTKNTTDSQLKQESERIKKETGVTLKFSKIKRNASGEIIAIKAEFNDKSGHKGTSQVASDEPIEPIRFFKNGTRIGFGNATRDKIIVHSTETETTDEPSIFAFRLDDDSEVTETPEAQESPEPAEAPEAAERKSIILKKSKSYSFNSNEDGKPTIIIDGEVIDIDTDKILAELDPALIESVKIMKSDIANGIKSDGGTIYIDTRKITREAMKAAEEGIKKARIEIERSKPEIDRAKKEIELAKPEMEQAKAEMEQAKIEMQKAKAELDKAKVEIEKAKAEMKSKKK